MKIIVQPVFFTNIVRIDDSYKHGLKSTNRDGKRIVQGKVWDSKKILFDGDSLVAIYIGFKSMWITSIHRYWLLYLIDLGNGVTRVTPLYELSYVKHFHMIGNKVYAVFKKKKGVVATPL